MVRSQAASVMSSSDSKRNTPAELTIRSSPPSFVAAALMACPTAAASRTSIRVVSTVGRSAWRRLRASSSASNATTRPPASTIRSTVRRPMPLAPPVTTTRQPVASIAIAGLLLGLPSTRADAEVVEQDVHFAGQSRVDVGRSADRRPGHDAAAGQDLQLYREERVTAAARDREQREVPVEQPTRARAVARTRDVPRPRRTARPSRRRGQCRPPRARARGRSRCRPRRRGSPHVPCGSDTTSPTFGAGGIVSILMAATEGMSRPRFARNAAGIGVPVRAGASWTTTGRPISPRSCRSSRRARQASGSSRHPAA